MKNTYFHLDINKLGEFGKDIFDDLNNGILTTRISNTKVHQEKFDNIILNNNHNIEIILQRLNLKQSSANAFFVFGPKGAGKSTYLRGSRDNKEEGLLLSLTKEVHKMCMRMLKKDERLIFKVGCFAIQDDNAFSLLKPKGKEYYDEFIIYNDNSFYIQHIGGINELKDSVEASILQRGKYIDKSVDYLLLYHVTLEVQNYTETVKRIQLDFFEFNYTKNIQGVNIYIENLMTKNFTNKKFYIERLIYKDIDIINTIYFTLVIDDLSYGPVFSYLKLIKFLKGITNRKDLLGSNSEMKCEYCMKKRFDMLYAIDLNDQLIKDLGTLNKQLETVFDKVKSNGAFKSSLASTVNCTAKTTAKTTSKTRSRVSSMSSINRDTLLKGTKTPNVYNDVIKDTVKLDKIVDYFKSQQNAVRQLSVNVCHCNG
jgi:hypothetical protein